MKSLDQFVTECKEKFDSYDMKAFDCRQNKSYKFKDKSHQAPKCKKYFSEEVLLMLCKKCQESTSAK